MLTKLCPLVAKLCNYRVRKSIMAAAARLVSRLTLVTGGGSGIGRAVCQRFASEGASVVVADMNEESANETLRSLQTNIRGQGHMVAVVDVSSKDSVKRLVTSIQARFFQPPLVCVNAAGITQDDFMLNMEEDKFDRVIQVNLKGSFLVTQAVAQALVACGTSKGSIITVGSIVGKVRLYITVSAPSVSSLVFSPPCAIFTFQMKSLVPLGRMGEPADVADVCAFLASDDSRYITGANIEVTGGLFIG
eukprot:XP_011615676.1 PREDICTED: estradiol 17-beta-dehydrogenase 8 [Takifugu rubripes]